MSDEVILTPTIKSRKKIDKSMIGVPMDFRHLAHCENKTESEKNQIRTSVNVIDAVNQPHYYQRPTSSTTTSLRSILKKENISLDEVFRAPSPSPSNNKISNARGYVNQPTSHTYQNIIIGNRPSTKTHQAPPPPLPGGAKPKLIGTDEEMEVNSSPPPVVFRQISSTPAPVELEQPEILTPDVIFAPKPNSIIIERPDMLMSFSLGLDAVIPVQEEVSFEFPIQEKIVEETPILFSQSPPNNEYLSEMNSKMSTIRSTSAQGKEILDDLDDWLDELDDFDREKLSTISTDESGYPTLASPQDRQFIEFLVDKYSLGVEPETVRVKKPIPSTKKNHAPIPSFDPSSDNRPKSLPPNRPPPSYDTPSYEAPSNLITTKMLAKQNAIDLRSTISSDTIPPELSKYFDEKKKWRNSTPGTISSGITDFSTTSSRNEQSDDVLSIVSERSDLNEIEIEEINEAILPPIPLPRKKLAVSKEDENFDMKTDLSKETADENSNVKPEVDEAKLTISEETPDENCNVKNEEEIEDEEDEETFVCRF